MSNNNFGGLLMEDYVIYYNNRGNKMLSLDDKISAVMHSIYKAYGKLENLVTELKMCGGFCANSGLDMRTSRRRIDEINTKLLKTAYKIIHTRKKIRRAYRLIQELEKQL